ncbi:divalent-cation tolerance protein CutA [Methanobrevibacter sp. DSM 116169]|uniref:divalent-cation tolerance protein CutA n=1 Tax=Methanobrevibacter sp. DSM 116169 TaxID=3242727 RepID=UPI0038FC0DE9
MLVLIYITCQDKSEAKNIANTLLKMRLCGCCNIIDEIDSMYWWENKIESDEESVLIVKTIESKIDDIIAKVKQIHSYDNPCILAIPTLKISDDYRDFIEKEVDGD